MNHTGFAPAHSTCAFLVYTAQAPGCSEGELSKAALGRMHFPSLSCSDSGSQLFHKGTDSVGPAFCGLPRSRSSGDQVLGESTVPGVWCILSPPCSQLLGFLGAQQECCLRCAVCRLWGADLRLRPSWQMSTVQDPRKTWLAMGSLLTVWWRMSSLGLRLLSPSGSGCRLPASLPPAGGWARPQPTNSPLVFA